MSTNYYLDSADNEAGHLGQWAAGAFQGKAPEGVNTFDGWAAQLDGHVIVNEYGQEVTKEEMVATALERDSYSTRTRRTRAVGDFVDRGVLFVRHEFF